MSDRPFYWAVGIENTNIGWPMPGSADGFDEYEVTGHYRHWRADLARAAESGANAVRYGFPWYRINPSPGTWDWSFTDQVVEEAEHLGLALLVDLVHYGVPAWLPGAFVDPRYPAAVASYAGQVAARYGNRLAAVTPLNEPLVTASFTGLRGVWPPGLVGEAGWAAVTVSIADGIQRSIKAIRRAAADLPVLHVEATHLWTTSDPALTAQRQLLDRKNYLPTDLVIGAVDDSHPLRPWLLEHGVEAARLNELVVGGTQPDLIGVNYYPELSARDLARHSLGLDGVAQVTFDGGAAGLRSIVDGFVARYRLPILISETAVEGSDTHRSAWLHAVSDTVHSMLADDVDVRGVVWWPLFDFVDWSWATGDRVIEEFFSQVAGVVQPIYPPKRSAGLDAYFRRMGLHRLATDGDDITRAATHAAATFRELGASFLPVPATEP